MPAGRLDSEKIFGKSCRFLDAKEQIGCSLWCVVPISQTPYHPYALIEAVTEFHQIPKFGLGFDELSFISHDSFSKGGLKHSLYARNRKILRSPTDFFRISRGA
jgi:hypothetical protein